MPSPFELLRNPNTVTLKVTEAADLLRISRPHAYKQVSETNQLGQFPIIRIGESIRVLAQPIRDALNIQTTEGATK
jgi:predicted DNA-binding transcriptional regulator AlpA